jgi:hypothetical protein
VMVLAALRIRDPLASLAVAFTASLVVLPVTWYHYPVALIPVGIALVIASPKAWPLVALAIVVAGVAIAFPPFVWVAVAIILAAVWRLAAARTGVQLP